MITYADVSPEAEDLGKAARLPENMVFTAYRPKAIRLEYWEKLLFFAHLEEKPSWMEEDERTPVEEMEAQAAGILGGKLDHYSKHSGDSRFSVPVDGEIIVVPEMSGVEFDPPRRSFFWRQCMTVYGETFRLRASAALDEKMARGRITVFLGPLILAEIGLAIRVGGGPTAGVGGAVGTRRSSATPFRKIFASYSHQDIEVVETLERHARTLGDEYLRDWMHLRSGEQWDARLLALVEQADVFQLFWSNNSSRSPFVEREWRHALQLGREAFVRPTYWELPMPPPPPELAVIHFHLLTTPIPRNDSPVLFAASPTRSGGAARPAPPSVPAASSPAPLRSQPARPRIDLPDDYPILRAPPGVAHPSARSSSAEEDRLVSPCPRSHASPVRIWLLWVVLILVVLLTYWLAHH